MTTIDFHFHFHFDSLFHSHSRFQFKFSQSQRQLSPHICIWPINRECIKKTWFPRDFHSNCLANREIDFHIATGCRFSNLDSRLIVIYLHWLAAGCPWMLLQQDRKILGHKWRQLPNCLHSVHNWKQFAICSQQQLQLLVLTHFVRRPSICWINTAIEIMELSSNIYVYAMRNVYANFICQRSVRMRGNLLNATLTVFCLCGVASFLQCFKQCFAVLSYLRSPLKESNILMFS